MFFDNVKEGTKKIQEISNTELCSLYVGIQKERYFSTIRLPEGGKAECISNDDDGRIFAGCSLFKVFIAAAVSVMIEKLSISAEPDNKFSRLRNAWGSTFTRLFNSFDPDIKIGSLYGNPTVLDLVCHFKGPCDIHHLFLAPDGSPLLSKNTFLRTISRYSEDTRQKDKSTAWCEYSNANYILLGLLIEVVSNKSLAEFLKEHIFKPLGMHRTYMTSDELELVPIEQQVQPHIVSGNGKRNKAPIGGINYLADTVEIAAMGGGTCAADIGKFFEKILEGLHDKPDDALFNEDIAMSLFRGIGNLDGYDDEIGHGYTKLGLCTGLDVDLPGSHSLNRLISSDSNSSTYTMGKTSEGKTINAYYMAGSATGWLSTVYFIPKQRVTVVVLTNTSGPLDMSDIVSRLCLQEILDLRPGKINDPNYKCQPKGWDKMTLPETYRAHYVELAAKVYQENVSAYLELEGKDRAPDTPTESCANAVGRYINKTSRQCLEVIDLEGVLGVRLSGESKTAKEMRFVRKDNKFRICSYPRYSMQLAIDYFGGWNNLEFDFEEENGTIMSFARRGSKLTDQFTRVRSAQLS